jgi:hypothetical protein
MMKCGIKCVVEKRNSSVNFLEAWERDCDCEREGMGCGCWRSSVGGLCASGSWESGMMAGVDIGDGDSVVIESGEWMLVEEFESGVTR